MEETVTNFSEFSYSEKEIILNQKLCAECYKNKPNIEKIEKLIKEGADPLGATDTNDTGEHIYDEMVLDFCTDKKQSKKLPIITEILLKNGMDVNKPRVPYDNSNSVCPLWSFTFAVDENAIVALKMLLDAGISVEVARYFWGHTLEDLIYVDDIDFSSKEQKEQIALQFKMLMLMASYDYIYKNDEDFYNCLDFKENKYDVSNFKNWNNYHYEIYTPYLETTEKPNRFVVDIYEKENMQKVWTIDYLSQ